LQFQIISRFKLHQGVLTLCQNW